MCQKRLNKKSDKQADFIFAVVKISGNQQFTNQRTVVSCRPMPSQECSQIELSSENQITKSSEGMKAV